MGDAAYRKPPHHVFSVRLEKLEAGGCASRDLGFLYQKVMEERLAVSSPHLIVYKIRKSGPLSIICQ